MNLRQKTFSAGRWTAASAFTRSAFQVLQTIVLARLLLPADFGLMALAGALLAVVGLFADFGLSNAIIHYERISDDALSSIYWLNITISIGLTLLFAAIAPEMAIIYNQPILAGVLLATSPTFVLSAFGQQFFALAEKELRFVTLASIEIIASITGFVVAVLIALLGGGVYALVSSILASSATGSLLAWFLLSENCRPRLHLNIADTKPFLRYGSYLVGVNCSTTLARQADLFIGGLIANPATLGLYSVPRNLSLRLAMIVNPMITRVGFPVMARLQDDRIAVKSVFLQTLRMTTSINFPAYVALGLFANEIIVLLYGPRWIGSGQYLRILAAWGLVRSIGHPIGSLLYAVGRTRLAFWWNAIVLVVVLPPLWLAAHLGGLQGLVWALFGLQLLLFIPSWHYLVRPCCSVNFVEFMTTLLLPLALALISGVVAYGSVQLNDITNLPRLIVGSCVGGCTYILLSLVFNRPWTDAVRQLIGWPLHIRN